MKKATAKRIAQAIVRDCLDRRGIKWEFERVVIEVMQEILDAWTAIIQKGAKHE